MSFIRKLFVALGAKTDKKEVDAFNASLDETKKVAAQAAKAVAAVAAVATGAGYAIYRMFRQTADEADAAAKGAQRYGVTIETFQELDHAAQLTGSTIAAVGTGLKNLARDAGRADGGLESSRQKFRDLGLNIYDTNGELKATDDLLMDLADQVASTENRTAQLAMATDALGRSGEALLPMLRMGRQGIMEMRAEAEVGIITAEQAAEFERFNDNLLRSRRHMTGWRNTLAVSLLPRANELVETFLSWAVANREVIESRIEEFALRVVAAINRLIVVGEGIHDQVQLWGGWEAVIRRVALALAAGSFLKFAVLIGKLGLALKGVILAVKAMGVAGMVAFAKPLLLGLLIVGMVIALGLAIEDVIVFLKGGESELGYWLDQWGLTEDVLDMLGALADMVQEVGRTLWVVGRVQLKALIAAFRPLLPVAAAALKGVGKLLLFMLRLGITTTTVLAQAWAWLFGGIADAVEWLEDNWAHFGDALRMMVQDATQFFRDQWGRVIDWLVGMVDRLLGRFADLRGAISNLPGMDAAGNIMGRARQAFAPSSERNPRTSTANTSNTTGNVEVNVNAQTNASAGDIGQRAAQATREALWSVLRQAEAANAGGEV